ncbi:ATP-binding protein [Myxococcota bacterium]|nr:ATP-binding protein [Myxococcota bacterium]
MNLEVQSALIGAFVTIAVMTSMLLRRRRRKTDVLFAILSVILTLWFFSTFLRAVYGDDPWLRVEMAIAALVPAALIKLFSDLIPGSTHRRRVWLNAGYPLSALVAVAALSPLGNLDVVKVVASVYIGGVILLASRLIVESGDLKRGTVEHARRRYLAIGSSAAAILAILGELPQLRGTWTAAGHLAIMVYVFFLSQIILRERLLDLNEFIGRMVILAILAVLFASISAILVGLGNNMPSRLFNAIVGVIILLTLYEPLKDRLEAKTIEIFFRERHRFAETLETLRRRMAHGVIEPAKMSQIVLDTLYDARRATHAAIYLLDPMGNGFELQASRGPDPASRVNAVDHPALWHAIQQNKAPLLTEQLTKDDDENEEGARKRDLIEAMRSVSADLLLPFVSGETVLGFLALRDDRSTEPYSTNEIASLMKVAETAATVIWNSKLAERLRERERLATIGAMSAGLAHEIRNPLGAIKGAAQFLDPKRVATGEEAELLQVIIDETNRLNSVVSQFLDYARPFRANFQPTDVNDVVRKTAKLFEAQQDGKAVPLSLSLSEDLPAIQADTEQVKQVILNLVLNGAEATEDKQRPVVVSTRHLPERDCIELRIKDQGCGIPREDLDRIFIPFFTTKQQGTGLGLAVCQRIVTNHGGTIHPESQVGRGTEFVIRLPVHRKDAVSTTGSFARPVRGASMPGTPRPASLGIPSYETSDLPMPALRPREPKSG